MTKYRTHRGTTIAALTVSALLISGLAATPSRAYDDTVPDNTPTRAAVQTHAVQPGAMAVSREADLRVTLTQLLGEHVMLAASATNAALGGRGDEFKSVAEALDTNSVDIANAIASVYGKEAGESFLPLWRRHIGFFVSYTTGVAEGDKAKQDRAVNELIGYTQDFGAFINAASPALSVDAVAGLVKTHALTLKAVVDAQAAGQHADAYMKLRKAYGHMGHISKALAQTIAKQFPKLFS